jgi:hypothetical protein
MQKVADDQKTVAGALVREVFASVIASGRQTLLRMRRSSLQ